MQSITAMVSSEPVATRRKWALSALRGVWLGLAPLLLAGLSQHYLFPAPMEAKGSLTAFLLRIDNEQPVAISVGLFLGFAGLLRYWQFYLPGMRGLAASSWGLPSGVPAARLRAHEPYAEQLAALTPARLRKLSPAQRSSLQVQIDELQHAVRSDDLARAANGGKALNAAVAELGLAGRETAKSLGTLLLAAALTLFARSSLIQPFRVLTESMLPTLEPGDWIVANRLAYGFHVPLTQLRLGARPPKRGDVIAFETPPGALRGQPEQLVKRVIGLPGDRILMRHGRPNINGWPVPSCEAGVFAYLAADTAVRGRLMVEFLEDKAYLTVYFQGSEAFDGYVVKPGEVFVLGDNRDNSSDSRSWNNHAGGGLPFAAIDGRVDTILLGTARDGSADWKRLLKPLGLGLRFDGMDLSQVQAGIEKCMREPPHETVPAP